MTAESYIKSRLLDFAVQHGARHGGVNNMLAAAQVICNRARAGWHGGDWLQVMNRAPDVAGTEYEPWPMDLRDRSVKVVMFRIEAIFHGASEDDLTGGALYFAEAHNITRPWFLANVSRKPHTHPQVAKVGEVSFFL